MYDGEKYSPINLLCLRELGDKGAARELQKQYDAEIFRGNFSCHTLTGHADIVIGVGIASDRNIIVSGSWDGTIKTWNLETGLCLRTLTGFIDEDYTSMVIAENVRVRKILYKTIIVSGGENGSIKIRDFDTSNCILTLQGHNKWVSSVVIFGDILVSASWSHEIKFWDLETGNCTKTLLENYSNRAISVAISEDFIVSAAYPDATIKLLDIDTGYCTRAFTVPGLTPVMRCVAISENIVASGNYDGTIRILDLNTGEYINTLRGHNGVAWSVAISRYTIVSGGWDNAIKIWRPA